MSAIAKVPLHHAYIYTVLVDGQPHVVLRPTMLQMGLDYARQVQRLKSRSWACVEENLVVGEDGEARSMATVNLDTWAMLLASIDMSEVQPTARSLVIAYQKESTRVVRNFWSGRGRDSRTAPLLLDEQDRAIRRAREQALVLNALKGVVDEAWLDAKGRHVAAIALGIEPDVDPARRPLTVGEYLEGRGVTGTALRSLAPSFGKQLKNLYRQRYGTEPPIVQRFVDGALRSVAAYTEAHRHLFDEVWAATTLNAAQFVSKPRPAMGT